MNGLTIALWILAIIGVALIVIDAMYLFNNWNVVRNTNAFKKTPIDQVLLKLANSDSGDYDSVMKAIMKVAGSWLRVFRVLKDSNYKYAVIDSEGNNVTYDLSNLMSRITPTMSLIKNDDNTISLHHTEEPVYNEETGEFTTKLNLYKLTGVPGESTKDGKPTTVYKDLPTTSPGRIPGKTDDSQSPNIFIEFFKPVEYSHIKH